MRKFKKLLPCFLCLAILFLCAACTDKATIKQEGLRQISKDNENEKVSSVTETNDKKTKEDTSTVQPKQERPKYHIEKMTQISDGLVEQISTAYQEIGIQQQWYNEYVPSEYHILRKELLNYATPQLIDGILKNIASEYCYGGCDGEFFPPSTKYSFRTEIMEQDENRVKFSYFKPVDEIGNGGNMYFVTLKKENTSWKLDDYQFVRPEVTMDFKFTKEEVMHYVSQSGDYEFIDKKTIQDTSIVGSVREREIYIFKDTSNQMIVGVYGDSGETEYDTEILDGLPY